MFQPQVAHKAGREFAHTLSLHKEGYRPATRPASANLRATLQNPWRKRVSSLPLPGGWGGKGCESTRNGKWNEWRPNSPPQILNPCATTTASGQINYARRAGLMPVVEIFRQKSPHNLSAHTSLADLDLSRNIPARFFSSSCCGGKRRNYEKGFPRRWQRQWCHLLVDSPEGDKLRAFYYAAPKQKACNIYNHKSE